MPSSSSSGLRMARVASAVLFAHQVCIGLAFHKNVDTGSSSTSDDMQQMGGQPMYPANPTFMYPGQAFSGFTDDYSALSIDPDGFNFAGGFSISFVASLDEIRSWSPILDVWNTGETRDVEIGVEKEDEKTGALVLRIIEEGGGHELEMRAPAAVTLGQTSRFLCAVTSSGEVHFFKDGDLIGTRAASAGFALSSLPRRHLYVGKSFLRDSPCFVGHLESLCIWREPVQWGDAEACNVMPDVLTQPPSGDSKWEQQQQQQQQLLRIPVPPMPPKPVQLVFTLAPTDEPPVTTLAPQPVSTVELTFTLAPTDEPPVTTLAPQPDSTDAKLTQHQEARGLDQQEVLFRQQQQQLQQQQAHSWEENWQQEQGHAFPQDSLSGKYQEGHSPTQWMRDALSSQQEDEYPNQPMSLSPPLPSFVSKTKASMQSSDSSESREWHNDQRRQRRQANRDAKLKMDELDKWTENFGTSHKVWAGTPADQLDQIMEDIFGNFG